MYTLRPVSVLISLSVCLFSSIWLAACLPACLSCLSFSFLLSHQFAQVSISCRLIFNHLRIYLTAFLYVGLSLSITKGLTSLFCLCTSFLLAHEPVKAPIFRHFIVLLFDNLFVRFPLCITSVNDYFLPASFVFACIYA